MAKTYFGIVKGRSTELSNPGSAATTYGTAIPDVVDAAPGLLSSLDIPTTLPRYAFD